MNGHIMSLYAPLRDFLADSRDPVVTLSFKEIEHLIGRRLPPSAHGENIRQWWANTPTHSQARAWLEAGRKARLDVAQRRVTFERRSEAPAADDGVVRLRTASLSAAALRLLQDAAEELGQDLGGAAEALLNEAGLRRRRDTLAWFAANTSTSTTDSAELIRADRDSR